MGEDRDVAFRAFELGDQPVGAGADVGGGLAPRRPVGPERPAGPLLADLGCGASLVGAVVPLHQGVARLRALAEAGEPARFGRPHEWAREHERERPRGERGGQGTRARAAGVVERHVGAAGVPARAAPVGLAVTHQNDLVQRVRWRGAHATGTSAVAGSGAATRPLPSSM